MNSKRLYQLLVSGILLLIAGLIIGAYALSSMLEKQAKTLTEQREQLAVLDGRETALKQAKADVQKYKDLAEIAKNIVPQDKSQAQTVREIVKLANANSIKLGSFTFPSSTLGLKVGGTRAELSQLDKVKDIPGVYGLQIVVQSDTQSAVPYDDFISFLKALEQNRRTAQVSNITINPDPENPSRITFSLTLQEYIKP
ncbi:hypothetical protein BH09PAT4_BH09PAT4_02090 [soil metagenome]